MVRSHSLRLHRVTLWLQGWHALTVLAHALTAYHKKPRRLLRLFASGIAPGTFACRRRGLEYGSAFWRFYTSPEQLPTVYLWSNNGETYIGKAKCPVKRLVQHLATAFKLRANASNIDRERQIQGLPTPSRARFSGDSYTMFFHTELALRGPHKFCVIPLFGPCALSELDSFERKLIRKHCPAFNRAHSRTHNNLWKNGLRSQVPSKLPTANSKMPTANCPHTLPGQTSPHRPDMLVPYRFHCSD